VSAEGPQPPARAPGARVSRTPTRAMPSSTKRAVSTKGAIGFFTLLIMLWIAFEHGRPPNPLSIPLVISVLLFAGWLLRRPKRWGTQLTSFVLLLVVMAIDIPLAANTFSAFWTTYSTAVMFVFIFIPLVQFIDSVRRMERLIQTLVVVALYIGSWAITHGGSGPAGAGGGQDENYVAAAMAMAFPFAYFSMFAVRSVLARVFFAGTAGVMLLACVVSLSRGGALAMGAVLLYCWITSSRRWLGVVLAVLVISGLALVPDDLTSGGRRTAGVEAPSLLARYWGEVKTSTDTTESTADLRLELWQIAFRMFLAHPLAGVGPGNFIWNITEYQSQEQFDKYGRELMAFTHSLYLELLADLGIAGSVLFLMIVYSNFRDLRLVIRRFSRSGSGRRAPPSRDEGQGALPAADQMTVVFYAHAITASLIGLHVAAAFLPFMYQSYLWTVSAMALALRHIAVAAELKGTS
jgi:O-antigen ligase